MDGLFASKTITLDARPKEVYELIMSNVRWRDEFEKMGGLDYATFKSYWERWKKRKLEQLRRMEEKAQQPAKRTEAESKPAEEKPESKPTEEKTVQQTETTTQQSEEVVELRLPRRAVEPVPLQTTTTTTTTATTTGGQQSAQSVSPAPVLAVVQREPGMDEHEEFEEGEPEIELEPRVEYEFSFDEYGLVELPARRIKVDPRLMVLYNWIKQNRIDSELNEVLRRYGIPYRLETRDFQLFINSLALIAAKLLGLDVGIILGGGSGRTGE